MISFASVAYTKQNKFMNGEMDRSGAVEWITRSVLQKYAMYFTQAAVFFLPVLRSDSGFTAGHLGYAGKL